MEYVVYQSVGLFVANRGKDSQQRKLRGRNAEPCGKLVCTLFCGIGMLFYPVGFFAYKAVYPLLGKSVRGFYDKRAVLVNADGQGFAFTADKLVVRRKIISL